MQKYCYTTGRVTTYLPFAPKTLENADQYCGKLLHISTTCLSHSLRCYTGRNVALESSQDLDGDKKEMFLEFWAQDSGKATSSQILLCRRGGSIAPRTCAHSIRSSTHTHHYIPTPQAYQTWHAHWHAHQGPRATLDVLPCGPSRWSLSVALQVCEKQF